MTCYLFVTGGVVSSLGKGILLASLGSLLKQRGLNVTTVKLDPYLNVDPGTMSPYQHGEVFVTDDGAETDLDLGHYERFLNVTMTRRNNFTAGQVYEEVLKKEREGFYQGRTVQVIPHVTDEIKQRIKAAAHGAELALVEIGGTVGDIESLPFLEAVRQLRLDLGAQRTIFLHVTLVPLLPSAGEVKTKPTQHSVKEMRSIGIQPDILVCRSTAQLDEASRTKIALHTNVPVDAVIKLPDVDVIYSVPGLLAEQGLDELVLKAWGLSCPPVPQKNAWDRVVKGLSAPHKQVQVAIVGKYMHLSDAYKSLTEALDHASIAADTSVAVSYLEAEQLETDWDEELLAKYDAVLIPGGFGLRGVEGKIAAVRYAREKEVPFLGICLGMQIAVIEYARNVAGLADAHSSEFDANCKHRVVGLLTEWCDSAGTRHTRGRGEALGGTMRLGGQPCRLAEESRAWAIYASDAIRERHRHRYEVNNAYVPALEEAGMRVAGWSMGEPELVEIVELPSHPWFIGCQFHPEFTSKPREGHPLFNHFIATAKQRSEARQ